MSSIQQWPKLQMRMSIKERSCWLNSVTSFLFFFTIEKLSNWCIQSSVAFHIDTRHLICIANQKNGFYMKCNTGLGGLIYSRKQLTGLIWSERWHYHGYSRRIYSCSVAKYIIEVSNKMITTVDENYNTKWYKQQNDVIDVLAVLYLCCKLWTMWL